MTDAKISDELKLVLASADESETGKVFSVIVSLVEGVEPSALERKGFKVGLFIESIGAASMTLSAEQIRELAEMGDVELIEYDGKGVWPL